MHSSRTAISSSAPEIVLKSVFKKYDVHGSGKLDRNAFSHVLDDLGIEDEIEQHALFALADTNNSKTLTFREFLNLIQSNDFEGILSNQDDYIFVIETYQNFLEFDADDSGEISWNEFYFYLTKHGYSHEYISNYWHYIGQNSTGLISFEQFWKAFRAQSEAYKVRILHQQINQQITLFGDMEEETVAVKNNVSATQKRVTIVDKDALIQAVKKKLKPTKVKKSQYKSKVGRVLDDSDDDMNDEEEEKLSLSNINSSSISNWVMERDLDEYSDVSIDDESTSISESDESLDSLDSDNSNHDMVHSINKPGSAPVTPNISIVSDKIIDENMNMISDAMNNIKKKNGGIKEVQKMDTNKIDKVKSDGQSLKTKKGSKMVKNVRNDNDKKDKNIENNKDKIDKKQSKPKTIPSKTVKVDKKVYNNDKKENIEMDKLSDKKDDKYKGKSTKNVKNNNDKKDDKYKGKSTKNIVNNNDNKKDDKKDDKYKSKTPKTVKSPKNVVNNNDKKDDKYKGKSTKNIENNNNNKKDKNMNGKIDKVIKDKKELKPKIKTPKTDTNVQSNDDKKENIEMDKLVNKKDNKSKPKTPKTTKSPKNIENDDKKENKVRNKIIDKKIESKTKTLKIDKNYEKNNIVGKKDNKSKSKTAKTPKSGKNIKHNDKKDKKEDDKKENIETDKISNDKNIQKQKDPENNAIKKKVKKLKSPKSPKSPRSPKTPKSPRNIPFTEKKDKKYSDIDMNKLDMKNVKPERDSMKIKIDQLPKHKQEQKHKHIQKEQKEEKQSKNMKLKNDKNYKNKNIKKKNIKKAKSELPKVKKKKSRQKEQRQKDMVMARKRLSKRLSLKLGTKIDLNELKKPPKKLKPIKENKENKKNKKNKIKLKKPGLVNQKSNPVTPTEKEKVTQSKKNMLLAMSSSVEIDGKSVVANPNSPIVSKKITKKRAKKKDRPRPKSKPPLPKLIDKSKSHDGGLLPKPKPKLAKTKSYESLKNNKKYSNEKRRSSKKSRTQKRSNKKSRTRHVKQPTFGMGFALFSGLRKQDQELKKQKKQKEAQIRRQSQLILNKKSRTQKRSSKKMGMKKRSINSMDATNHIRQKSQQINSMAGLIDFKPNARSHKYIFRHLHEKTSRFVPADSSKWDRNWDKIYKQREKIRKLKQKNKMDKLKDFKTLQKEKMAKVEEANKAFIDPHYKLPLYAADAGHWDRDWNKINESRQKTEALKKKNKEDKKKDFKTLQKEKQEKIDEINKAFINPHYKLPIYSAYAGHWDRDWDKINKRRMEIELLKKKKKADKKKDKKTLLLEKQAKADEANQVFIDPHYKLPLYAANKSNWDRDWDKINKAREEIRKLKEKQREKKRELMEEDRSRSITPSVKKYKSKKKIITRSQTTDDITTTPKHKKKSSNIKVNKKYEKIKLQHKDFMIWINENELQSIVDVFIDCELYEMELINAKNIHNNFTKLMADDRVINKTEIRRKIVIAIRKLEEKDKHIQTERRESKKKVQFEDLNVTFFASENTDTKSNDDEKLNDEPTVFLFDTAIDRQRSRTVDVPKRPKSTRTIMRLDQKNKDHKTIINEARNNLEDFMIKYGFWQIDFFLILVEYGIHKPDDLGDLTKSERKEIIKIAKQRGLLSARVKAFKAYFNE